MSAACCDDNVLSGPGWTPAAHQLGVRGFLILWSGERRAISELTTDPATVQILSAAGRLELDDQGVLVGVHGLVARATSHRIEHAGGTVHTWCALDAIGIPAALALDATAVTSCPNCGAELRVVLRAGHADRHDDLRLWLPGGPYRHLVKDFCRHTNLYCNRQHLSSVVPVEQPGRAITVAEAAGIGRVTWADVAAASQDLTGSSHDH